MDLLHYMEKGWQVADYDCWSLVCEVYQRELGIELPRAYLGSMDPKAIRREFANHSANQLFEKLSGPVHFAVVAMGNKWLSHVGVYLETADGPRILHNRQANGVLCQPLEDVSEIIKIIGCYGLK